MKYSLRNTFEMTLGVIEDPLSFSKQFTPREIFHSFIHVKEKLFLISYVQLPIKSLECASTTGAFIFT